MCNRSLSKRHVAKRTFRERYRARNGSFISAPVSEQRRLVDRSHCRDTATSQQEYRHRRKSSATWATPSANALWKCAAIDRPRHSRPREVYRRVVVLPPAPILSVADQLHIFGPSNRLPRLTNLIELHHLDETSWWSQLLRIRHCFHPDLS